MQQPFFTVAKNASPCVKEYTESCFVRNARFEGNAYQYVTVDNVRVTTGGLLNALKAAYYPDYEENRSKRKWATTNVKGSTAAQGKQVDAHIMALVNDSSPSRLHPMARAIHTHLVGALGHVYEAAQLPVLVRRFGNRMTQVDLITRDFWGRLHVWEIKTGVPVGGFRQQGHFNGDFEDVKCTKYNIWQLQLSHTREALESALNVTVHEAHVIQVYTTKKDTTIQIKVHDQEDWTVKKRKS